MADIFPEAAPPSLLSQETLESMTISLHRSMDNLRIIPGWLREMHEQCISLAVVDDGKCIERRCEACGWSGRMWDDWIRHFQETEEVLEEHVLWVFLNRRI